MLSYFRDTISRARRKGVQRLPLSLLSVSESFKSLVDLSYERGGQLTFGQIQHLASDTFPRVYPLKDTVSANRRVAHIATASAFWQGDEGSIAILRIDIANDRDPPRRILDVEVEVHAIRRQQEFIPEPISIAFEHIYAALQPEIKPFLRPSAPRPRRALVIGPENPVLPPVSGWAQLIKGAFYVREINPVLFIRPGDSAQELEGKVRNEDFDVLVSWQPVPSPLTRRLHLAFKASHVDEQLVVIDEATFEGMMHTLRGELDARISLWTELVPEPAQVEDPANVEDALRQAAAKSVRLKFTEDVFIQARQNTYPHPRRIRDHILIFDEILDDIERGRKVSGRLDQLAASKGVDFARFISKTQAGTGAYEIHIDGVTHQLGPHIKFGRGLPKNIARVYMVEVRPGEFWVCDIRRH